MKAEVFQRVLNAAFQFFSPVQNDIDFEPRGRRVLSLAKPPKQCKLRKNPKLQKEVASGLARYWSNWTISGFGSSNLKS